MSKYVFTVRSPNIDRFFDEQYLVRQDFEKLLNSTDEKEIDIMLEKYELFIEDNFEPYAAMHESRQHSNLWGKLLIYSNEALETDHIGYYKPVLLNGEPTTASFNEQYPHLVTAWVYDHKYLNADFDYTDTEKVYVDTQLKGEKSTLSPESIKEQLDQAHRH